MKLKSIKASNSHDEEEETSTSGLSGAKTDRI